MSDTTEHNGVERTVRMGSMAYIDAEGRHRRADCGAVVQVHADHVERFDRLNRPMISEAAAEAELARRAELAEADEDGDDKPARRRSTSTARKDT